MTDTTVPTAPAPRPRPRPRWATALAAAALALPLAACTGSQSGGQDNPDNQFTQPPAPEGVEVSPSTAAS